MLSVCIVFSDHPESWEEQYVVHLELLHSIRCVLLHYQYLYSSSPHK
jgi:hypothetical protein